ncbi:MAG: hypothetical protein ACXQT4_04930 [Methanotrichaceae archaeon]
MRVIYFAVAIFFLVIASQAIEVETHVEIDGGGALVAAYDTENERVRAQGVGEQYYDIYGNFYRYNNSNVQSYYDLNSSYGYMTNRYKIEHLPKNTGIRHDVDVHGSRSILSNSSIEFDDGKSVRTDYQVDSIAGSGKMRKVNDSTYYIDPSDESHLTEYNIDAVVYGKEVVAKRMGGKMVDQERLYFNVPYGNANISSSIYDDCLKAPASGEWDWLQCCFGAHGNMDINDTASICPDFFLLDECRNKSWYSSGWTNLSEAQFPES